MLSPNTLLNKGRYLIGSLLRSTPEWAVYSAVDQTSSGSVLCIEYAEPSRSASDVKHDGLMTIADSFVMNGRTVQVTEPISTLSARQPLRSIWDRFAVVLMGLNTLAATSREPVEIAPGMLVKAKDGRLKLLSLQASTGTSDLEAWHIPLEVLWRDLDHISQKAIYNAWDDKAIEALELPADNASAVYSLGALFYRELTERAPVCSFERTLVELDGADPLADPAELMPELGSEASSFLMRCLALRREARFRSFEEAVMSFPSLPEVVHAARHEEIDELLEVPAPPIPVTRSQIPTARVEPLAPLFEVPKAERIARDLSEKTPVIAESRPEVPGSVTAAPPPVITRAHTSSVEDDLIFSAAADAPRRSLLGKLVFAAVGLAAVAGGGWAFYNYSSSRDTQQAVIPEASSTVPAPEVSPTAVESAPPTLDIATASAPTDLSDTSAGSSPTNESSAQKTAHPAAKPATTSKPAPAAPQIAKKKVTVDDLINDN